jgi:hypothetical protein
MESVRSTVNKFQDSIDSNVSVFDVEMTNDAIKSDDSWTSSRKNYNCETETSEVLPPEMIGKGANKRVNQKFQLSFKVFVIITENVNIILYAV